VRTTVLLALCLLLSGGSAAAEEGTSADGVTTRVGIRIGLPESGSPNFSVEPDVDQIRLDLPAGAVFPEDFAASSGGLLQEAAVEVDGDRVRLSLQLVAGILDRIDYEPGAVILRLKSRFAPPGERAVPEDQYVLGSRDRLFITVHGHDDLSGQTVITREGVIIFELVGEVQAAGLSPRQLSARLAELLGRYIVDPKVDVDVEEYRSQWVMLTGEVSKRGRIPLRGGTRLKEALTEAQGLTDLAGDEITISRKRANSDETVKLPVSRQDLESGRLDPTLMHGDVVEVKRARWTYVYGEVRSPGRVTIDDREMSLMRVITQASGFTDWADLKHVKIQFGDGTEQVFNIRKIMQNKREDPLLEGGEVIIVPRRFL